MGMKNSRSCLLGKFHYLGVVLSDALNGCDRALLTLDSAIPHLNHFCAVIPSGGQDSHVPIYELDPPDYVEGWHSLPSREHTPYQGPWAASVTLPRALPQQ